MKEIKNMNYAEFDLHLHTEWSYDATAPAECYFQMAKDRGVKYIAITEHFHMDSLQEIWSVATSYPEVKCIQGAELTGNVEGIGIDLVCLGLPAVSPPPLRQVIAETRQWQNDYAAAFSSALKEADVTYTPSEQLALLRQYRPARCIAAQGITLVQGALERDYLLKKYFGTIERYNDVIWDKELRFYHKLPPFPDIRKISAAVHAAGGLVFIAHPHDPFKRNDEKSMDQLREHIQFDGIECAHTHVPRELTPFYRSYCLKHGLLSSAGTDCHSIEGAMFRFGADASLGVHAGEDSWMREILERLPKNCFVPC